MQVTISSCRGNPAQLLKGINPSEGQLLESSVNCHVRFRLGGESFPPNIYYKIFSKSNVCDINAFAPRDYSSLPRVRVHRLRSFPPMSASSSASINATGRSTKARGGICGVTTTAGDPLVTRCSSKLTMWKCTQPRRWISTTTRRKCAMKSTSRNSEL